MIYQRSSALFAEAKKYIPGGVNSPVRAFKAVGGDPIFVKKAKGAYLYDEDGNKLIDYIASWGPLILGHAHEPVINAVIEKAKMVLHLVCRPRLKQNWLNWLFLWCLIWIKLDSSIVVPRLV